MTKDELGEGGHITYCSGEDLFELDYFAKSKEAIWPKWRFVDFEGDHWLGITVKCEEADLAGNLRVLRKINPKTEPIEAGVHVAATDKVIEEGCVQEFAGACQREQVSAVLNLKRQKLEHLCWKPCQSRSTRRRCA